VLGESELSDRRVGLKLLRKDVEQVSVEWSALSETLMQYFVR
jgi:hypothetical protein